MSSAIVGRKICSPNSGIAIISVNKNSREYKSILFFRTRIDSSAMAKMQPLAVFILSLAVLSPVLCGKEAPKAFVTLDVAASLKETRQGVYPRPASVQRQAEEGKPWSLKLVHRDALVLSALSFEQRTKQRLARDSLRVKAITARVDLAANGIRRANLKPLEGVNTEARVQDFQTPVISGMQQGSGEYFASIGVGQPARDQYVVLDTGSDVIWVQCQPCSDCYEQTDPIFNPSMSSTFNAVHCDSNLCQQLEVSACRNSSCLYQVSYGDGSYSVGSFATETITLGKTPIGNVAIGCGHDNEGLFVGASGLLGLGGGSLSFPTQIADKAGRVFSYCLIDRDSSYASTLDFGAEADSKGAVFTPLIKNRRLDTFYYITLTGISVGGKPLPISPTVFQIDDSGRGGIIVDSGTAVTRLQSSVYSALRDAFVRGTKHLRATDGVSLFDTCYDLSSHDSVSVPTVGFHFPNGASLSLPAKNYLVPVDTSGTFCLAFAPTSSSPSIIGNIQQQSIRVSFDSVNNRVGFSVNGC